MTEPKNRTQLQKLFKSGAKPSEADFKDLIDGSLNIADDGIAKPAGADTPLKISTHGEQENVLDIYTGDTPTWRLNQKPTTDTEGLNIETGGESKLFIESSTGNLGVGITKPIAKLHIQQSGGQNALRIDDETGDTTPLIVNDEGKVGIGTDTPEAKLDIKGDTAIAGTLKISQTDSDFADFYFHGTGMGQLQFIGWSGGWNINSKTDGKHLHLNRDSGKNSDVLIGKNGNELTVRGSDGNVGIGTSAENNYKLKVEGNTKVTGTLSVDKNVSTTGELSVTKTSTLTGKVGIGVAPGTEQLKVRGDTAIAGTLSVSQDFSTAGKLSVTKTSTLTGKVGIGTAPGTEQLKVQGDTAIAGKLSVSNDFSTTGKLSVTQTSNLIRGLKVDEGALTSHINTDGALYRKEGQVYFTVDDNFYFRDSSSASDNPSIHIDTKNKNLRVYGKLFVNDVPSGDHKNVQWNPSNGQFYQDNSSRKTKENIMPLKDDFMKLLQAKPKTYTRPGNPSVWEIGCIAEEFDELDLKKLVYYESDGSAGAIHYDKISLYLIEIIKNLHQRIEDLEQIS